MLKVKRLVPDAEVPQYQSAGAAGLDLHAAETVCIEPGRHETVRAGVALAIPTGHVGLIFDRSSVAKEGLHTMAGVIDSDYRGEIKVMLLNTMPFPFLMRYGDRIAQLLIIPCLQHTVLEVNELDETERGSGGFGSTGV